MEVHREVGLAGWFDDEEVFQFIGEHLFLMSRPSFRFYLTARNLKNSGADWKGLVLRSLIDESDQRLLLVARLLADSSFNELPAAESAREAAFKAQGGGSRATNHRHKRELLNRRGSFACGEEISIRLGPVQPDPMYTAMYDRRRQLEEMAKDDWDDGAGEGSMDEVGMDSTGDETASKESANEVDEDEIGRLGRAMERAIQREEYERAAKLRDQIRRLEENNQ